MSTNSDYGWQLAAGAMMLETRHSALEVIREI